MSVACLRKFDTILCYFCRCFAFACPSLVNGREEFVDLAVHGRGLCYSKPRTFLPSSLA